MPELSTYYINSDDSVATDYLNPVLAALHFWPVLEKLIYQRFGGRR